VRSHRFCWHPTEDNLVAVVNRRDETTDLLDLHVAGGGGGGGGGVDAPVAVVRLVPKSGGPAGARAAQLAFLPRSQFELLSLSSAGALMLWDLRAGSTAVRRWLLRPGAQYACVLPLDDRVVAAGASSAAVECVDLRSALGTVQSVALSAAAHTPALPRIAHGTTVFGAVAGIPVESLTGDAHLGGVAELRLVSSPAGCVAASLQCGRLCCVDMYRAAFARAGEAVRWSARRISADGRCRLVGELAPRGLCTPSGEVDMLVLDGGALALWSTRERRVERVWAPHAGSESHDALLSSACVDPVSGLGVGITADGVLCGFTT
jgi:hypothetical protein